MLKSDLEKKNRPPTQRSSGLVAWCGSLSSQDEVRESIYSQNPRRQRGLHIELLVWFLTDKCLSDIELVLNLNPVTTFQAIGTLHLCLSYASRYLWLFSNQSWFWVATSVTLRPRIADSVSMHRVPLPQTPLMPACHQWCKSHWPLFLSFQRLWCSNSKSYQYREGLCQACYFSCFCRVSSRPWPPSRRLWIADKMCCGHCDFWMYRKILCLWESSIKQSLKAKSEGNVVVAFRSGRERTCSMLCQDNVFTRKNE